MKIWGGGGANEKGSRTAGTEAGGIVKPLRARAIPPFRGEENQMFCRGWRNLGWNMRWNSAVKLGEW